MVGGVAAVAAVAPPVGVVAARQDQTSPILLYVLL